jgi:predicted GNAT family N-acyltransferase
MIVSTIVANDAERALIHAIRTEVFVKEQGVDEEAEHDEHDAVCDHILVYYDQEPVGTGRLRLVDGIAKLERICVKAAYREKGIGKHIMGMLEEAAVRKRLKKAKLTAQIQALPFYEKLGYRKVSDVYLEQNIPHVTMLKDLP